MYSGWEGLLVLRRVSLLHFIYMDWLNYVVLVFLLLVVVVLGTLAPAELD